MTAKDVCVLSWHSTRAGAVGVADLALPDQNDHRSEHLRKALGTRSKATFFTAQIPMWDSDQERR
eukprot:2654586-Pyramimonas_sp.AAC.1